MNDRVFLDTNILVYLYSKDENNKRNIAYKIVNFNDCIISTQIFNEACNVWYKKYKLNKAQIAKYLDEIELVCEQILLIQRKTINQALSIKDRYDYSYFDSLMLLLHRLNIECGLSRYFAIRQGTRREHSHCYVTDE